MQFVFRIFLSIAAIGLFLAFPKNAALASPISYSAITPLPYGSTSPCASPITGAIAVTDSFTISDLNIRFLAAHTWRTDTNFSITSPAGTVVALLTGPYTANLDNYNVIFDDEAGVVVDTGAHAVNQALTGPGVPVRSEADPLSDFDGENSLGVWTYSICDVYTSADNGTVQELTLIFDVPPELNASKTVANYDPAGYAVPGADVLYSITATNSGLGTVDADTMFFVDTIPAELVFYNGDIDDGGPEIFPVAFNETGSGLSFTYATDVAYSNAAAAPASMAACTYVPSAGYDANIRHICVNPKGEFLAGSPDPTMSISFRMQVQ